MKKTLKKGEALMNNRLKLTASDMLAIKKTMEKIHKEAEKKNKLSPNSDMKFFEVF
jgi:hypothetical protein